MRDGFINGNAYQIERETDSQTGYNTYRVLDMVQFFYFSPVANLGGGQAAAKGVSGLSKYPDRPEQLEDCRYANWNLFQPRSSNGNETDFP